MKQSLPVNNLNNQEIIKSVEFDTDNLASAADKIQVEQEMLLENEYSTSLESYVQAKLEQVDRIEDKIEALIHQQSTKLQKAQSTGPGLLALPGQRVKWQSQIQQQQSQLVRLQERLDHVKEIRQEMGPHVSKIEEFAFNKLKADEPELVADWEEMKEAQRRHEALCRKKDRDKKEELSKNKTLSSKKGLSQSLYIQR